MVKKKLLINSMSFILCFALVFGFMGSSELAADDGPSNPTGAALNNINEAADFLEEMGMTAMAENIRLWLKDNKIKIDLQLVKSGSTTAKGIIHLNKSYTEPFPKDTAERFNRVADLAAVLYHEKIHAHQAPLGGALAEGIELGDWSASNDVMKECVGPDPLEVEAFYKQIRALLKWWQNINAGIIPGSLSGVAAEEAEQLKEDKKTSLMVQFEHAMRLLKSLNYEKASKFDDLEYLTDLFDAILDTEGLSEEQIIQQTVDLLDSLISKLFDKDGFYDKCRQLYATKKGTEKTSLSIPAEPGSSEEYALDLPGGNGFISIYGLPADLNVGDSEMLDIVVTEFMIPPNPDAGYSIISPVYEISWNSYSPVPFDITIYAEGMHSSEMIIKAFALTKTKLESAWTDLETQSINEENFHILTSSSDTATMFAVIAPAMKFIDMPPSHWAYDSTARLYESKVLDEGVVLFPDMKVTRELFVKYLVKAMGLELITESVPFTDVSETDPYFTYISTAYYNKLTTGVADDRFGFGEIIPREQSITFLIRALGMEEKALGLSNDEIMGHIRSFVDIYTECSEWAYPYISQAVKNHLVNGYPDGSMRGKSLLAHAEVITLIDRIMISIMYSGN